MTSPRRVEPHGVQHRGLAHAVLPGKQGDAAQAGDGQLVYAPEPFYVEVREMQRLGFRHRFVLARRIWARAFLAGIIQG